MSIPDYDQQIERQAHPENFRNTWALESEDAERDEDDDN